jgi:hypothetical protein
MSVKTSQMINLEKLIQQYGETLYLVIVVYAVNWLPKN